MKEDKYTAIQLLSKHHKEYIKMAKSLAGNNFEVRNYAEDFVQEGYLRLLRYDDLFEKVIKKDRETVSKGYMFFVLRSIIINRIKKKSNIKPSFLGSQYDFEEKYNWVDEGMDKDKLASETIEAKMYEIVKNKVHWWDYELFRNYLSSNKSFRAMAAESGLGITTIYLSIKKSKMIIAEELFEDYQDYLNGETYRII